MNFKKLLSVVCVMALSLSMMAGCSSSSSSDSSASTTTTTTEAVASAAASADVADGETIKIGTIYSMTGGNAAIGSNILLGIDFAVAEINELGGINGHMVEVVRGDHAGDAATGKSEAERLITQEDVDVIMGCHMSVVTEVVAQVCQQYSVPMITAISTLDFLSDTDHESMDYFFRLCPLSTVYVENMLMFLQDTEAQTGEKIETVAIFTDKAAIGQSLIDGVEAMVDAYGIELVATVDYTSNATDLSAQVLALKQADPDALLVDCYIGDATLFIQTLKEQNYSPDMIVARANGFADPSFITNLGSLANGVASIVEFSTDLTNAVEINAEFNAVTGVDMNGHSAEAYTVVWVFKEAMEACGESTGEALKVALQDLVVEGSFTDGRDIILPYDTIDFVDSYELNGETHYRDNTSASVAIAQIQDGAWATVWPFSFTDTELDYPAPLS